MIEKYILHPKSVVQLADEIKRICNDYWDRKINGDEVKEFLMIWANHTPFLFYEGKLSKENLNKSIRKIIGKKRVALIFTLLNIYE